MSDGVRWSLILSLRTLKVQGSDPDSIRPMIVMNLLVDKIQSTAMRADYKSYVIVT